MDDNAQLIETLLQRIATLEVLLAQQAAEIAELKKRLSKNSSNSSKPPSSDGLGKSKQRKNNSLRSKSKKKNGGQPGHKGETLKQTPYPDEIIHHEVDVCPTCRFNLGAVSSQGMLKRQVFDIPLPSITVTEHQCEIKTCPSCTSRVTATFPAHVNAPVQYGPVLNSYAVYLKEQQLLPEERLQQTFLDLFNVKITTATLARFSENVYEHLALFEDAVLNKIKDASVKHLDETGFRIIGKTQWLHVASNAQWTYYHHSPKRKSLLEGLRGMVVHDHWRPYYQLKEVAHVLCNAHHLRELKSFMEEKEHWAHQMWRLLRFSLRLKHDCGKNPIADLKQERLLAMYDSIIVRGLEHHKQLPSYTKKPKRGRRAKRPGHNLLLRLKNYREDATRFIREVDAPFTNNLAERDLRMMKVKQKISGCFRSKAGASRFVRIRSFISTARKQGWNILDSIAQAVAQDFILPA